MFNNYYKTRLFSVFTIFTVMHMFSINLFRDVLGFFSPVIALILALPL